MIGLVVFVIISSISIIIIVVVIIITINIIIITVIIIIAIFNNIIMVLIFTLFQIHMSSHRHPYEFTLNRIKCFLKN